MCLYRQLCCLSTCICFHLTDWDECGCVWQGLGLPSFTMLHATHSSKAEKRCKSPVCPAQCTLHSDLNSSSTGNLNCFFSAVNHTDLYNSILAFSFFNNIPPVDNLSPQAYTVTKTNNTRDAQLVT